MRPTLPAIPAGGMSGVSRLLHNHPPAIEQRATMLAGQSITYTLKRSSKRRSIGLRIDDRGLTVSMPLRASELWLDSVLSEKAAWVVEKLQGWQARLPLPKTTWQDGEALDYLGEQLTLRVERGSFVAPAQRRADALYVFVKPSATELHIERAVMLWYRTQALQLFTDRCAHYAALMAAVPLRIELSTATTLWGCCTASGTVRLNLQLIKLPLHLIDYVVVHELAHLHQMNHSAAFWAEVKFACPDYLKHRAELKAIALA
ncbi:MAG: M48 family metallopeptidase [Gallionella sp.]